LTLSLQQSVEFQPHRWIRKGSANQKSATKRCCQIHGTVAAPWIHNVGFANSPATETFANTGSLSAGLMDEVTDEFELIGIQTSRGFSKTVNSRHLKNLLVFMELTSLMGPFSAGSTRALEEEEVWTVIRIHDVGYTSATGRDLKLLKCEPDSDNP